MLLVNVDTTALTIAAATDKGSLVMNCNSIEAMVLKMRYSDFRIMVGYITGDYTQYLSVNGNATDVEIATCTEHQVHDAVYAALGKKVGILERQSWNDETYAYRIREDKKLRVKRSEIEDDVRKLANIGYTHIHFRDVEYACADIEQLALAVKAHDNELYARRHPKA